MRYSEGVPGPCPHSRLRAITLILRGADGRPEGISVSVACGDCGVLFRFPGVQSSGTVLVAEDRREVRMLIEETSDDLGTNRNGARTEA